MKLQTTLSTGNISKLDKFWAESIEPISIWFGWRIALFIFPIFAGMFFPPDPNSVGTPFSENLLEERLVGSWTLFHYTYLGLCLPLLGVLTSRFVLWYWVA